VQCAVLCGGLATRMLPLTSTIPKSLLVVAGKPFLEWQLMWMRRAGITDVVLCVGHLAEQVAEYLDTSNSSARFELKIRVSDEGEKRRGTAGALALASTAGLLQEQFLVLYGDSLLPIDVGSLWEQHVDRGFGITMSVLRNANRWDVSNASYDGTHVNYNKQSPPSGAEFIDYGLLAFPKSSVDTLSSEEQLDLSDVLRRASEVRSLFGFEADERFFEIGSKSGLHELEAELRRSDSDLHHWL
jgi:N-acetyl-alpha-D-muramate 1-phosphate uridylyltransferase